MNGNASSMKIVNLIILLIFGACVYAHAQNKISGRVTDATTGEPVAFANVFFANTTVGTTTNAEGYYSLSGFPPGKYDLTFSFVGYNPLQRAVAFTQNQEITIDVKLEQESKVLSEVLVKPDTLHWRRNYEDFKRLFLGTSSLAQKSVIENPRDIHLYFDPSTKLLVAHAKKPIIIVNPATGYRIQYYLYHFEYNASTTLFTIYGLPQFEELIPKSKREENQWKKTRAQIYEGSLLHFMRSWLKQQWVEEGFTVARLYRVPNRERPSDEFLAKKISALRKQAMQEGKSFKLTMNSKGIVETKGDSLAYYLQLRSLPKEKDSVVREVLTGGEFTDSLHRESKNFSGLLTITFREREEPLYAMQMGRADKIKKQQTIINLLKPIKLYPNGYYEDVRDVFLEQYWSWSEKISTLLPLDYWPPKK